MAVPTGQKKLDMTNSRWQPTLKVLKGLCWLERITSRWKNMDIYLNSIDKMYLQSMPDQYLFKTYANYLLTLVVFLPLYLFEQINLFLLQKSYFNWLAINLEA